MPEAIVIREYGGADVLVPETVAVGAPGPGEIRLRQTAVGVNYHDVYVRSGLYKTLSLPGVPGCEAAGVVEAVGAGVDQLSVGDRVAYVTAAYGAYASHRLLDAGLAVRLPDSVSDATAASNLLRAMTVDMGVMRRCCIASRISPKRCRHSRMAEAWTRCSIRLGPTPFQARLTCSNPVAT